VHGSQLDIVAVFPRCCRSLVVRMHDEAHSRTL
jgi:hypothetical protein